MTRQLQRLFGNGYTYPDPHPPARIPLVVPRTVRPSGGRVPSALATVAVGLLVLGLSPAAMAGAPTAGPSPLTTPLAHYDAGRVNVVYPSSLPVVQLVQDANASLTATLSVAGIYEIAPGGLPTPTVVAAAFPSTVQGFNGSGAAGTTGAPVSMFANLAVYPVGLALWAPNAPFGPTGAPVGGTTLAIAFTPTPGSPTTQGVAINWTVGGWPWVSPADSLAIAFSFDYATGDALTACQSPSLLSLQVPPCSGQTLSAGESAWGSGYASVEGEGGTGPVAVVGWSPAMEFGAASAPVVMGAFAANPGAGSLLLMGTPSGTGPAAGALAFSLVAPTTVALPSLVSGNALLYGGTAGLLATVAALAIGAYRRNERRSRESL